MPLPHLSVIVGSEAPCGGPDDLRTLVETILASPPGGRILAWFADGSPARELLEHEELAPSPGLAANAGLWADRYTVL